MATKRKPQDAVVANVKRLRRQVKDGEIRVRRLERLVKFQAKAIEKLLRIQ